MSTSMGPSETILDVVIPNGSVTPVYSSWYGLGQYGSGLGLDLIAIGAVLVDDPRRRDARARRERFDRPAPSARRAHELVADCLEHFDAAVTHRGRRLAALADGAGGARERASVERFEFVIFEHGRYSSCDLGGVVATVARLSPGTLRLSSVPLTSPGVWRSVQPGQRQAPVDVSTRCTATRPRRGGSGPSEPFAGSTTTTGPKPPRRRFGDALIAATWAWIVRKLIMTNLRSAP
jgi:hypothetical protein